MGLRHVRDAEKSNHMRKRQSLQKCLLPYLVVFGLGIPSAARVPDPPQIVAVEPKTGITTPGSRVTVYGTSFSPDAVVYFGGLQVRETKFIGPTALEVVTPYLRPGDYQLQLKFGEATFRSEVTFKALPSKVDSEIDRAVVLAGKGATATAISILTSIAKTNSDYQVRAYAHYRTAQVYFEQGDLWRWGGEAAGIFGPEAGMAVQTSWQYRLSYAQSVYLLPIDSDPDTPVKLARFAVENDVTQNPEPLFFRSLLTARFGDLQKAKVDSDFILKLEPGNASYRALAAYIAMLGGDKSGLEALSGETTRDARALSLLGEAAYLSGDAEGAQRWWTVAAKEYPLGAGLACMAGKKHLARGQQRISTALLNECITMAPDSSEAKEAKELLTTSAGGPG